MKLTVLRAWVNRRNNLTGSATRNWRINKVKVLFETPALKGGRPQGKQLAFLLTVFLLLSSILITACKASPPSFITAADFHFDPFLGCEKLSHPCPIISELRTSKYDKWDGVFKKYQDKITTQYRTDASYFLMESTVHKLKKITQEKHPQFMLILGDFMAHGFPEKYQKYADDISPSAYQAFIRQLFQFLTWKLNKAMPTLPIYPLTGNDDSYEKNYEVDPGGAFLKETAETFSTFIKDETQQKEFLSQFPAGGYYALDLLSPHAKLLMLNTVLFTSLYRSDAMDAAAEIEMEWLKQQLELAKQQGQKVLLTAHIPPGIDAFASWHDSDKKIHELWKPEYTTAFLKLLGHYKENIVGMLTAHIHMDTFQLTADQPPVLVIYVPAISPLYGNNPAFKLFYYENALQLSDFEVYKFSLDQGMKAQWGMEYNFNKVYYPLCLPESHRCCLEKGMKRFKKDNAVLSAAYRKYYASESHYQDLPLEKDDAWIPYYWCAVHHIDAASYQTCVQKGGQ